MNRMDIEDQSKDTTLSFLKETCCSAWLHLGPDHTAPHSALIPTTAWGPPVLCTPEGCLGIFFRAVTVRGTLGREKAATAFQPPWPPACPCSDHACASVAPPGPRRQAPFLQPDRSTCVTGRQKEAGGLSGNSWRSGREPTLHAALLGRFRGGTARMKRESSWRTPSAPT